MMRYVKWCVVAFILPLLAGCSHPVNKSGVPGVRLRKVVAGDSAEYIAYGRVVIGNRPQEMDGTYRLVVKKAKRPYDNKYAHLVNTYIVEETGEYTGFGWKQSWKRKEWCGQSKDGSVYLIGRSTDDGRWTFAKGNHLPMESPGMLTPSSSWGYTVRFDNDDVETMSCKVIRTESIKTPAGTFATYKVRVLTRLGNGKSTSGYQWMAPKTGFVVESETEISEGKMRKKHFLAYRLQNLKLAR